MTRQKAYLLDASALLALLLNEDGAAEVEQTIDDAAIHSVSFTEVVTKLAQKGAPADRVRMAVEELALEVDDTLSLQQAQAAGELHAATRDCGLSLGDVVCLSVAKERELTAVTCDRTWIEVGRREGIQVICVRQNH